MDELAKLDGFVVAALIDSHEGLALMVQGEAFDLKLAARGQTEVLRAKRRVAHQLKLDDRIEEILITMQHQYHLLRPLKTNAEVFIYLVLERHLANLAWARFELRVFEQSLDLSDES